MSLFTIVCFFQIISFTIAAALFPAEQVSPARNQAASCPITITQYSTVTMTDTPPTVTIAVPDSASILKSLASVSSIDSLQILHQTQNAPVQAPKLTETSTFIHSILAPAFVATQLPSDNTDDVIYAPVNYDPSNGIMGNVYMTIGYTTVSVAPKGVNAAKLPGPSAQPLNFKAQYQHVDSSIKNDAHTETVPVDSTVTAAPVSPKNALNSIAPIDSPELHKRQTCVLISANIGGHWASWCNNWDGEKSMTYTSWETTITPSFTSTVNSADQSSAPEPAPEHTTTVQEAGPPTTVTETLTSVQSSTTSTTSTPTDCGQLGDFDIGFDELPAQSANNDTAALPPIFSPFDHFYWDESWSYVPPPPAPYPPQNGDQLAIYKPSTSEVNQQTLAPGEIPVGGFGDGPRATMTAYWFNAYWAYFGCDAGLKDPSGQCDFVAMGYRYNQNSGMSELHATQHFSQPLCATPPCSLQRLEFTEHFTGLTALSFYAMAGGQRRIFYMDTIHLSWWNNTCGAGRLRGSNRK